MTQAVSVTLDEPALQALGQLEATGMSRSEAIRKALVEGAFRLQDMNALASKGAALDADEEELLPVGLSGEVSAKGPLRPLPSPSSRGQEIQPHGTWCSCLRSTGPHRSSPTRKTFDRKGQISNWATFPVPPSILTVPPRSRHLCSEGWVWSPKMTYRSHKPEKSCVATSTHARCRWQLPI